MPPETADTSTKSKIYVVSAAQKGPCKIGIARNVWGRFWQLQSANFLDLELVAVIEPKGSAPAVERMIHHKLREHRIRGEWFAITARLAVTTALGFGTIIPLESINKLSNHNVMMDPHEALRIAAACHPRSRNDVTT